MNRPSESSNRKSLPPAPEAQAGSSTAAPKEVSVAKLEAKKNAEVKKSPAKKSTKKNLKESAKEPELTHRQPDLEDQEGFAGFSRRPVSDPFRVGEEVVHNVHYFKVSAGELRMKVEPFVIVNNRKSYSFTMEIRNQLIVQCFLQRRRSHGNFC